MINNRQNGRRRGRGGQRPQGNPGQPGGGNRIDNRARGNAQQLHEKYRNLARDSQLAGDRVTTEYYLQFADHYFRVLNESRARFEDQRRQRGEDGGDDEFDGEDEFEARDARDNGQRRDQDRDYRRDRDDNRRDVRPEQADVGEEQPEGGSPERQADDGQRRPRRANRRPRDEFEPEGDAPQTLNADVLPPAITVANEDGEEPPAPRRRGRRPRADAANDAVEIPPAA